MKENKIVYICTLLAAWMIIVSSLARAIGVNDIVVAATTGDISRHYAASVLIDWSFSSLLLLLVAVWLLFLARDLKKLQRRAWSQAMLIGLALSLFNGYFWYRYPSSLHLPFFLLTGLLILIPLIIFNRDYKRMP